MPTKNPHYKFNRFQGFSFSPSIRSLALLRLEASSALALDLLYVGAVMKKNNVISLEATRKIKRAETYIEEYKHKISKMDKLELLEEMVRFQEKRSQLGQLTPKLMILGQTLFRALEQNAESDGLRTLTRSYRRHLELELAEYRKNQQSGS